MWISEETAQERLNRSSNILNRINRDESSPADYPVEVPVCPPESIPEHDPALNPIDAEFAEVSELDALEAGDAETGSHVVADMGDDVQAKVFAAMIAGMGGDGDEPSEEVLSSLRASIFKKKASTLTRAEAADAVLVGQLTNNNHSAHLFGKHPGHLAHMALNRSQSHRKDDKLPPTPTLVELIEGQRTKIRNLAFERLETVLSCLSKDKIQRVEKARDLANIATQLSSVADRMLPKEMQGEDNVHFHILRPEVKKESDYEIVEVGAER